MKIVSKKKQIIGFIIALSAILIFTILPGSEDGLSHQALMAVGLFIAAVVMWMTEVFPLALSSAVIVCLYPLMGVMDFRTAISGFSAAGMLFIFGTFAITAAMRASTLPLRITNFAIKLAKGNSKKMILTFCLATGLVSSFMSSTAVCVMFWMFANTLLKTMNVEKGKSNLARALAITVPVAAGVGGFMTPAGTPGNVLLMDFMAQNGVEITFTQWTIIGLPLGLICLLIFAFWAGHVFKPEEVTEEAKQAISNRVAEAGKLDSSAEYYGCSNSWNGGYVYAGRQPAQLEYDEGQL